MEDCVKYDGVGNVFRVRYPFTEDPLILKNNFREVLKIGEREERKLANEGLTKAFNQELSMVHWLSLRRKLKGRGLILFNMYLYSTL